MKVTFIINNKPFVSKNMPFGWQCKNGMKFILKESDNPTNIAIRYKVLSVVERGNEQFIDLEEISQTRIIKYNESDLVK